MRTQISITALLSAGTLLVILLAAWVFRTALVQVAANYSLAANEVELTQLSPLRFGSDAVSTAGLELTLSGGQKLELTDVSVGYRMDSWLQPPVVDTISVADVRVLAATDQIATADSARRDSDSLQLSTMLQILREFPLESAKFAALALPGYDKPLVLEFQHEAESLVARISNSDLQLLVRFSQIDANSAALLKVELTGQDERIGDFSASLTPMAETYAVQGQGQLQFADLDALLGQMQQAPLALPLKSANIDWMLGGTVADDVAGTFDTASQTPATFTLGISGGSTITLALPASGISDLSASLTSGAELTFTTGVDAHISSGPISLQTSGLWNESPFGSDGKISLIDCNSHTCRLNFNGRAHYDNYAFSGNIDVSQLQTPEGDATEDVSRYHVKTSSLIVEGVTEWLPGVDIDADLTLTADQLEFSTPLQLREAPDNAGIALNGRYAINSGVVDAHVTLPVLTFSADKALSKWLQGWPYALDLLSGSLAADADIQWQPNADNSDSVLSATLQFTATSLGGMYGDVFFRGLNTSLHGSYDDSHTLPLDTPDLMVTLDGVDVGMPLTNISTSFRFNRASNEVLVTSLSATALDGTITARDLHYVVGADRNDMTLAFNGLHIERMMELADYDGVQAAGAVSGELPLTLTSTGVEVAGGSLHADSPGGTIRYLSKVGNAGDPGIDLVNKALANYQYDSLVSSINYSPEGELVLGIQLQGTNPEMSKDQRINLNLNLTDNIPDLLKSLQAAREIEDFLQQQYQ